MIRGIHYFRKLMSSQGAALIYFPLASLFSHSTEFVSNNVSMIASVTVLFKSANNYQDE